MADIVTIGMDLDATKVVTQGRAAEQALTGVEGASKRTDSAMATLTKTAATLGLAFGAYKAVQMAKEVLTLGARYETLGVVVDRLGRNVNKSATEMRALESDLRKTGISMIEARSNIARMVQAEMELSNATKLARVAQDAAVIGNMNSSEAFANLVYGVQTANTRILRTIGIMVNFESAYAKAAKTLNKNADALTEQEKTQARVNAVMEAGGRIAGSYEAAMETAGKQIQSTKRYLEDAKVKVSEAFQPAYTKAVFAYAEVLKLVGFWAKEISFAIAALMAVMVGKGVSMGTAALVRYNLALKATAAAAGTTTFSLEALTVAAKGAWAALGGWITILVLAAVAANAALDKYLAKVLKTAGMTEAETAAFDAANKAYWERIDAQEKAAAAAAAQAEAAKEAQKELGLELEKQTALVKAFGSTEHEMALLNLRYEEKEALAKAAEGVSAAQAKALQGMTAAIYAQKRALVDLEEQKRKMGELIKPLETTMEGISGAAGTLISLDKELEARKALLVATQEGAKAVRELAITEAGVAAAAQAMAAGMPEAAERARQVAEVIARINFEIEDFSDKATGQFDVVGMALEAMGQQLGGLAGDIGQVVAQFFVMGRAAKLAADKAGEAFDAMDFVGAGTGGALPGIIGMSVNALLGELFGGDDDAGRQAEELRRAQEANTQALDRVAKSLDDYGRQLAGMSVAQVQDARAVWQMAGFMTGQQPADLTGGPSVATIIEVAKRYGMEIENIWKLSAEEWEKLYKVLGDVIEEARKYIQEQVVPDFAARAATLRGDDREAMRIRREAAAAKEIAELTKLAEAGFITTAQLTEFTGVINDETIAALKAFDDALAESRRVIVEDLIVRGFAATGQSDAAARASLAFTQRRERIGMEDLPQATQDLMLAVQDFERRVFELDVATNNQIKAIEEATAAQVKAIDEQIAAIEREIAARDFARSVMARGLRVTGRGGEADILEMGWQHQAERAQFRDNPIMLGFLDVVQGLERDALVRGQALAAQTSAIQAGAAAQQAAYDTQIRVAQDQLRVAEDQLHAQQQLVEETRRVVEALDEFANAIVLSEYSPLSPIQQLAEARRQFEDMAAAAMGGNVEAGAGLPEAARNLLTASRAVNASNLGYATDFARVQQIVAAVREQFAGKLGAEESVLVELQTHTASLRTQIDELVSAREQVAISAAAQIEALNAAAAQATKDAQAVYDAAWEIAKEEVERLETFKQEQIDQLTKDRELALELAQLQIDAINKFRDDQLAAWADEFNATLPILTAQYTAQQTTNTWLGNINFGVDTVASEVRTSVRVLQAGFNSVIERLGAVETAVSGVGTTVKRGLAE